MSRPRLTILAILAGALISTSALGDPAGFAFLKVPAGARASAMGGAYASIADGVEAAFWNPAALDGARGIQLEASHFEYLANLRHDQFAIAGRLFGGGIAASLRALYSEPIPERDALGNLVGSFGSDDLEFGVGYGRAIAPGWRFGGSAQVVHERIADAAATTYDFGTGVTWNPARWSGLRLSADLHDLGPATHFTIDGTPGDPVRLPAGLRTGASWTHGFGALTVRGALENSMLAGQASVTALGAEVAHSSGLALRGGLRTGDTESTMSLGAGWAVRSLRLDYAFVPFRSNLGDTHRFSLGAQF
ncbi:MAG TPA: PorV/PorQ family protein [Candidatus Udaeobacter sp.]|nr:PorV/PorQ family protein [Candidatus Udaeobacter sp.]